MMGDLTVSEKRLIAALDRIDYSMERAAERLRQKDAAGAGGTDLSAQADADPGAAAAVETVEGPDPRLIEELQDLRAENARLTEALAAADAARLAAQARIEDLGERLNQQGQEAARLVATNETLSNANRNLLSRADSGGANADEARMALEAELHALRSARAAEIAQFSEVLDTLETMLAESGRPANGRTRRAATAAHEERG